jgi:hypothetical protein
MTLNIRHKIDRQLSDPDFIDHIQRVGLVFYERK